MEYELRVVYEYRLGVTVYCDGERRHVERLIPREEFWSLFGGWVLTSNSEGTEDYLGVWGRRNASKLRRILRERGAEFSTVRSRDIDRRLVIANAQSGPPTDLKK